MLSPAAQRVQDALRRAGFDGEVRESDTPTRTAAEAARLVGADVAQIAKSLVFRATGSRRAVLVVASGAHRVSETRIGELVGEPVEKADADFVREATGFAIGGVPPLGHARAMEVLVDEDLMRQERIWAAAGTPNSLFELSPSELVRLAGGRIARVR